MCARVQSDVLRVLRVLRGPVFQFCTCLWRHVFGVLRVLCVLRGPVFQLCTCLWRLVFGVLRVLCVLLGLYVLYALCALYAFSKTYVQHCGPQKRASGQNVSIKFARFLCHFGALFANIRIHNAAADKDNIYGAIGGFWGAP